MKFLDKKSRTHYWSGFLSLPALAEALLEVRNNQFLIGMDDIWIA